MSRFFDLDAANETLPELRTILETLRDERAQLIALRDEFARRAALEVTPGEAAAGRVPDDAAQRNREDAVERKRLRLRMQGVIDQMQAGVARIDELGVTLREIETGLVDFPALVNGRQVWLCWRLGEGDVEWWHELSDGFGGRHPLIELA
ncbi:MAG TPA: DUF2203 domain-containing protein [Candidatus Limnocylindrales bacterium]|nr:DUF2203 domain-containing protein [Candidatus Limnocylindrales bacterium]